MANKWIKWIPIVAAGGVVAYLLLREEEEPPPELSAVKERLYAIDPTGKLFAKWQAAPQYQQMRMLAQPLAPDAVPAERVTVSANLATLSRSLDQFNAQQAKIRQQQGLTMYDVVGSDQIDASQVLEMIKQGNPAVFTMPLGLPKYQAIPLNLLETESPVTTGRMHIYIDTMESFHYFANLIYTIFLMTYPKGKTAEQQKQYFEGIKPLIQWFQYHKFHIKPGGIVQTIVKKQMDSWMCSIDDRTIRTYYTKYDGSYPGLGFVWDSEQKAFAHCKTTDTRGLPQSIKDAKYEILVTDGLQLMIEYGAVKFANFAFASAMNPALGSMLGQKVGDVAMAAVSLAALGAAAGGLLGTAAAASAAGPAGWIAAGVALVAAGISAAFAWAGLAERNDIVREDVADHINFSLREYFRRGTIKQTFSGYRLKLLLPQGPPGNAPWEDLTDTLWPNYVLVSSYWPDVAPQLPFYYLNIDFDIVCTIEVPWNKFLILRPIQDERGLTYDWEQKSFYL